MAAAAYSEVQSIAINRFVEVRTIIRDSLLSLRPDVNMARCITAAPEVRELIASAAASLIHRLRTNCAFTKKKYLHLIGRSDTLLCGTCGLPRMFAAYYGRVYDPYIDVRPLNYIRNAGRPYSSLPCLLFPLGPPSSVRFVFGALLQFLEWSGFAIRL